MKIGWKIWYKLSQKKLYFIDFSIIYDRTTDDNGIASIGLNLNSGMYNITVSADNKTVGSSVNIKTTVNGSDITKVFRNATQYYATFLDSAGNYLQNGTTVRFNINGVMYERQVSGDKGLVKLNINLEQGEYIITNYNPVTGEENSNKITVVPKLVENSDLVKIFGTPRPYTVKVLGDDGKAVGAGVNVKFNIHGVFYNRTTNASGIAQLNINLEPENYAITAEYEGCRVSNSILVIANNETVLDYTDDQSIPASNKTLDCVGDSIEDKLAFEADMSSKRKT